MSFLLHAALVLTAPPALAATDGDVLACDSLADGDPCTRENGDAGTCVPDDSDPDVLKCEDEASSGGGGGGCAMVPAGGGLLVALALLLARRSASIR